MGMFEMAKAIARALGMRHVAGVTAKAYAAVQPNQICKRGGIRWELDLSRTIDYGVYLGGWEPETLKFLASQVKPGDIIIEIGANIGAHTLPMSKMVGDSGVIYAFEPTMYALKKLKRNLQLNPKLAKNIKIYDQLVTNGNGDEPNRKIRSAWKRYGSEDAPERVEGKSTSIDSFISTQEIDLISMIKIDVDGYDYKVLEGAVKTLQKFRPIIFIELAEYCLNQQGDSVSDIFNLLGGLGYEAYFENGSPIENYESVLEIIGFDSSINACFFSSKSCQAQNLN